MSIRVESGQTKADRMWIFIRKINESEIVSVYLSERFTITYLFGLTVNFFASNKWSI